MSSPISWQNAKTMMKNYSGHEGTVEVIVDSEIMTLRGVRFDADQVSSLLQCGAQEIFLMFGMEEEDTSGPRLFTLILAGINEDNQIITAEMYDSAAKCPDMCPVNMPAVHEL